MKTEEILIGRYGPLLTLVQLAEVLIRSPQGLRISLTGNSPLSQYLNPLRLKIGRRVYFRSTNIAELLDGGPAVEG